MFQLLSVPLQPGLRFFRPPIPARSTTFLTVRLPAKITAATIRACHVPDVSHDWFRLRLSPGGPPTT
ncbi:hypothetical protein EGY19_00530 [Burkholderia multivorans]|nr:hypothetical protein EGY19_00530 [Burkholderia multivorans]PRF49355.1 hypothetical protein C6Q04_07825 [Burkholderia multivorans]PRG46919.1 hypothetical protein C6T63_27600 [Burkholderia multivorans]